MLIRKRANCWIWPRWIYVAFGQEVRTSSLMADCTD